MKRTANIVVRVSPKEKKILEGIAKKEGLTFSAWVRRFAYVSINAALKAGEKGGG
jgi:hypothetical protein